MEPNREEWRDVVGLPTYEVSSAGRVRRKGGTYGCKVARLLRPKIDFGYLVLSLSLGTKGSYRFAGVHVLVCEAFIGPRPTPEHEVAHGDGVRTNNIASNLRWATALENAADRERHGKTFHPKGALHPNAKLTEEIVLQMRALKASGTLTIEQIAEQFCVAKITAYDAIRGTTWSHL